MSATGAAAAKPRRRNRLALRSRLKTNTAPAAEYQRICATKQSSQSAGDSASGEDTADVPNTSAAAISSSSLPRFDERAVRLVGDPGEQLSIAPPTTERACANDRIAPAGRDPARRGPNPRDHASSDKLQTAGQVRKGNGQCDGNAFLAAALVVGAKREGRNENNGVAHDGLGRAKSAGPACSSASRPRAPLQCLADLSNTVLPSLPTPVPSLPVGAAAATAGTLTEHSEGEQGAEEGGNTPLAASSAYARVVERNAEIADSESSSSSSISSRTRNWSRNLGVVNHGNASRRKTSSEVATSGSSKSNRRSTNIVDRSTTSTSCRNSSDAASKSTARGSTAKCIGVNENIWIDKEHSVVENDVKKSQKQLSSRKRQRSKATPPQPSRSSPPPPLPSTDTVALDTPNFPVKTSDEAASVFERDEDVDIPSATAPGGQRRGAAAKSGGLCPVCGSAVWGLSIRARQVHINSCLDASAVGNEALSDVGVLAGMSRAGNDSPVMASGRRESTGVAKEPKTAFQEHIQMAKALSKSLVAPAAAEDPLDDEELAQKDPTAFRAKGRRLVETLRDIDAKLERLNRERENALKKLAAHRALGAKTSVVATPATAVGVAGCVPQTMEEVVGRLFSAEDTVVSRRNARTPRADESTNDERWRTRREARMSASSSSSWPAAGNGPLEAPETAASADTATESPWHPCVPREEIPTAGESITRCSDDGGAIPRGEAHTGVRESDGDDDDELITTTMGETTTLLRRRSCGGRTRSTKTIVAVDGEFGRTTTDRDKDTKGTTGTTRPRKKRTLWSIAQEADELSQSNFVTGVFADVSRSTPVATPSELGQKGARGRHLSSAPKATVAVVTAAAYGDASMYNARRSKAYRRNDAHTSTAVAASRTVEGGGNGRREQETSSAPLENGEGDDGVISTTEDYIRWLSQVLPESSPRSTGGEQAEVDPDAAVKVIADEKAARMAARQIAGAPSAALASVFPAWEENVRFVFEQDAASLREALRNVRSALVAEEENQLCVGPARLGGEDVVDRQGRDEKIGQKAVGGGAVSTRIRRLEGSERNRDGGKALSLRFFEGVIAEALEFRNAFVNKTTGQSSAENATPALEDAERDTKKGTHCMLRIPDEKRTEKTQSGAGDDDCVTVHPPPSTAVEQKPKSGSGDGDEGDEEDVSGMNALPTAIGESHEGSFFGRGEGSPGRDDDAAEDLCEAADLDTISRRDTEPGDAIETLPNADHGEIEGEGVVETENRTNGKDGHGDDHGGDEDVQGRCEAPNTTAAEGEEESDGAIVLSGDSCCGLIMTFDLTDTEVHCRSEHGTDDKSTPATKKENPRACPSVAGGGGDDSCGGDFPSSFISRQSITSSGRRDTSRLGSSSLNRDVGYDVNVESKSDDRACRHPGFYAAGDRGGRSDFIDENDKGEDVKDKEEEKEEAAMPVDYDPYGNDDMWQDDNLLVHTTVDYHSADDKPVDEEPLPRLKQRLLQRSSPPPLSPTSPSSRNASVSTTVSSALPRRQPRGRAPSPGVLLHNGDSAAGDCRIQHADNGGRGEEEDDGVGSFDILTFRRSKKPSPSSISLLPPPLESWTTDRAQPPLLPVSKNNKATGDFNVGTSAVADFAAAKPFPVITPRGDSSALAPACTAIRSSLTQGTNAETRTWCAPDDALRSSRAALRSRSQPVGARRPPLSPPPRSSGDSRMAAVSGRAAPLPSGGDRTVVERMPVYEDMTLQELAGMMSVYGLKKRSKREMIERLEKIWKALHPGAAAAAVPAASTDLGCDRDTSGGPDASTSKNTLSLTSQRRHEARPSKKTALALGGSRAGSHPPRAPRSRGVAGGSPTIPEDDPPTGSRCALSALPPLPPLPQQQQQRRIKDNDELGDRIHAVLTGHAQLHEDILLLKTIELSATQLILKNAGVKCSKRDLSCYLDDRGITHIHKVPHTTKAGELSDRDGGGGREQRGERGRKGGVAFRKIRRTSGGERE